MDTIKGMVSTITEDVTEASRRTAVIQVVKVLKTAVATAFARANGKGTKREIRKNMDFLGTPLGDALFKVGLGSLLPLVPPAVLGPVAPHLAWLNKELRVQGTAQLLVMGTDMVLEPMQRAFVDILAKEDVVRALGSLPLDSGIPLSSEETGQVARG